MKDFEIIQCENGWLVLDGSSFNSRPNYAYSNKKWVARSEDELADLIRDLTKLSRIVTIGKEQTKDNEHV